MIARKTQAIVLFFIWFVFITGTEISISRQQYQSLLLEIDKTSAEVQAEKLKNYIKENPHFYPAYLKLIDVYVVHERNLSDLISFFTHYQENSISKKFSFWALAKINYLQQKSQRAYQLFLRCLAHPNPCELLYDFISAARVRFSLTEIEEKLQQFNLPQTDILVASAFYHFQNSDYAKAIALFQSPKLETKDAFCLFLQAKCYISLRQYEFAQEIWKRKITKENAQSDLQNYARFLMLAGIQEKQTGSIQRADSLYDLALTAAMKIADTYAMEYLCGLKGNIAYIKTNYDEAMKFYLRAIFLASRCGCFNNLIVWQTSYGKTLAQINRYAEALEIYDAAERIAQLFNYQKWAARVKLVKGDLFSYLNQPKFAIPFYAEVCRIAQKNNYADMYHLARSSIADTLIARQEFQSARKIFRQTVEYFKSTNNFLDASYYLWRIGDTYMDEKNYSEAKKSFQQAFNLAKKSNSTHYQTWYLTFLAEAEAKSGNFSSALRIFRAALATAQRKNYFNICIRVYRSLGDLYFEKDSLQQAISLYRQAIARIEKKRRGIKLEEFRIGFFSDEQKTYRKLTACYLKLFKEKTSPSALDSLFYFDQLSRARTLIDLKLNSYGGEKQADDPDYFRYLQLCTQLRKTQRRIRELVHNGRNDREVLKKEIGKLHAIRYSLLSKRLSYINRVNQQREIPIDLTLSLADLKRFSAELSASIIVYHFSEWSGFSIIANSDSVKIIPIEEKSQRIRALVDSLIKPFHRVKSIEIGFAPFNAKIAHLLYEILFQRIDERVRLTRQVLIVPDLAIVNLPMSMLLTQKTEIAIFTPLDKPIYKDYFLLQKYSFGYVPSVSLLKSSVDFFPERPQIAVFADPIANKSLDMQDELIVSQNLNWCFHQLNFAEQEAKFIKNISSNARIFHQDHATKKTLYQNVQTCDILHFATHAFVDNDFDLFSGLTLSAGRDTTDDGMFMGYELSDLNFKPKLAVLNGCETGKGEQIPGEGTLGLPRLFLIAGCKSVIMSLWRVEDKFASQFMPEFYAYFLGKKTTQMEALRRAQLKIIDKSDKGVIYYAHPFFWSAFLCYGQPISMVKAKKNLSYYFTVGVIVLGILAVAFFSGKIRKNKRRL